MTVMLPKSRFIHIPKTGGSWVRAALRNSKISLVEPIKTLKHSLPEEVSMPANFTFAFVRNPWDWLRSWWAYRMTTNWRDANEPLDIKCKSSNFNEFVDRVLEHFPGVCTYSYQRFLGANFDAIDFIGRTENLAEDLQKALQLADEKNFDASLLASTPPINAADYSKFTAVYTPEQHQSIANTEAVICEQFSWG